MIDAGVTLERRRLFLLSTPVNRRSGMSGWRGDACDLCNWHASIVVVVAIDRRSEYQTRVNLMAVVNDSQDLATTRKGPAPMQLME